MAYDDDDDDDLFAEEFDFVDDDESDILDSELESDVQKPSSAQDEDASAAEKPKKKSPPRGKSKRGTKPQAKSARSQPAAEQEQPEQPAEAVEPEDPLPPATDHVVHLYEFGNFCRTIQRDFTEKDAVAFAEEYNRTSNPYSRAAVAAGKEEEPEPAL